MFESRKVEPELPTLDIGHLTGLERHLGAAVLAELIADALFTLPDRLARLEQLARGGDFDRLGRTGHDLLGLAGNLGLSRLVGAVRAMNWAAREATPAEAAREVRVVSAHGADAVEALRHHLAMLSGR